MNPCFDHLAGHFCSVGVSADWVAFENLGLRRENVRSPHRLGGLACYRPSSEVPGVIAVIEGASEGTVAYEFELWREIARALDRAHVGKRPQPSGRLSSYARGLADYRPALSRQMKCRLPTFHWMEITAIAGSLSPHDPDEVSCVRRLHLADPDATRLMETTYGTPAELFAHALAQFVACPQATEIEHRSLAADLRRIIERECGIRVR